MEVFHWKTIVLLLDNSNIRVLLLLYPEQRVSCLLLLRPKSFEIYHILE